MARSARRRGICASAGLQPLHWCVKPQPAKLPWLPPHMVRTDTTAPSGLQSTTNELHASAGRSGAIASSAAAASSAGSRTIRAEMQSCKGARGGCPRIRRLAAKGHDGGGGGGAAVQAAARRNPTAARFHRLVRPHKTIWCTARQQRHKERGAPRGVSLVPTARTGLASPATGESRATRATDQGKLKALRPSRGWAGLWFRALGESCCSERLSLPIVAQSGRRAASTQMWDPMPPCRRRHRRGNAAACLCHQVSSHRLVHRSKCSARPSCRLGAANDTSAQLNCWANGGSLRRWRRR